ncbi:hypothetical protein AD948_07145 [Acetobacter senegalensis]|uniref:Uncharacterized protein n=1 Tax=Acetobacter senegalensis TaxID=446692 RepID=A0A149U3H9_9PROT|nr:hypothetical protein AD948_07145 [Acetobacter senegalensis]
MKRLWPSGEGRAVENWPSCLRTPYGLIQPSKNTVKWKVSFHYMKWSHLKITGILNKVVT